MKPWRDAITFRQHRQPYLPDTCCACQKEVKQVFGYVEGESDDEDLRFGLHELAFTAARLSQDLEQIQRVASNEELRALGLNPIGRKNVINGKPTKWPHCNLCIHCRAPQNNFHLGEKLRADMHGPASRSEAAEREDWNEEHSSVYRNALATIPRVVLGEGYWELKGS